MRFPLPASALLLAGALASPSAFANPPAAPPVAPTAPLAEPQLAPTAEPAHVTPGTTESKLPAHGQQKPAMVTSGIVVTVVGACLLAGGAAMVVQGNAGSGGDSDSDPWPGIMGAAGIAVLVSGAIHAVVGVSLISAGMGSSAPSGPKQAPPQVVPAIAAGPRSVTMRWVF